MFQTREASLDILRGLVLALMIVVNNPGGNQYYSILLHNYESYSIHLVYSGLSLADLVLPLFIFVLGATVPLSFTRRLQRQSKRRLLIHVLLRALVLFALGLVINGFPYYSLGTFRIMGVLQMIALAYLVASLAFLFLRTKWRVILTIIIPLAYWILLIQGPLTMIGNIPAQVDNFVLRSGHIYNGIYDPEGLLSTFSACATVLIGVLVGEYLLSEKEAKIKVKNFGIFSLLLIAIGLLWSFWLPINKGLWTSSYVVLASGISLALLAFCYIVKNHAIMTEPFKMLGLNCIIIYVLSELLNLALIYSGWKSTIFSFFPSGSFGSLLYSIAYLGLFGLMAGLMYWKKVFIKI